MSNVRRILAVAAVVGLIVAGAGLFTSVSATDKTAAVGVSATVNVNCTISAGALAFGATYDPVAGGNVDGTATITVACTKGATATIALDDGGHFASSTRNMDDGSGNLLPYALYSNAGRTTAWDSTTTVSYTAASKSSSGLTVYGRIPTGADVPAGAYNDSVTATITY
jgi:spore coat protein U-like protein